MTSSPDASPQLKEIMSIRDGTIPLHHKFPGVQYSDSVCINLMHLEYAKLHIEIMHSKYARLRPATQERWNANFTNAFAALGSQNGSLIQPNFRYQKVSGKPANTIMKEVLWNPFVFLLSGDLKAVRLMTDEEAYRRICSRY